ncbi:amidohydrolase family protein [Kitasatospora sp. NPDC005856]|uniref:amidohydrolase family protein n=1 Tax=Kitasatospora sp. NPDC005856 TaxID=3154566 RepID=UPI0033FB23E7
MNQNPQPLALTNALLIDGTGAPAVHGATVVITGHEITVAGATVAVPEDAAVVDLRGKAVLPGLIDAHVHLGGLGFHHAPPFGGREATGHYAVPRTDALRHGVTTQRSLGDFLHDSIAVRDAVEAGTLPGARLAVSGPSFQVEHGHPNGTVWGGDDACLREAARTPESAAEAAAAVEDLAAVGVDLVKIIISNNAIFGPPRPELKMPWHLVEAIVDAAHGHGLKVAAHTETVEDSRRAVDIGVDDIEHLLLRAEDPHDEAALDDLFALMAARGTYLVPTMVAHQLHATADTDARTLRYGNQAVRRAYESGVRLGVGSDAHSRGLHGWKLHSELIMMVHDQGIPAHAALTAATRTNAELLGLADRLGTVAAGKTADLLIVSGNPLEDITAITGVHQVIQNGTVVTDNGA